MVRRIKPAEYKTTTERVAEHRERLKEAGLKRLDLSISMEAFESLQKWSKENKLSYSEAAEHLFLAASAPVSFYTQSIDSDNLNTVEDKNETIFRSQLSGSIASASLNNISNYGSSYSNSDSVVSAFFKTQLANQKENDNGKEEK